MNSFIEAESRGPHCRRSLCRLFPLIMKVDISTHAFINYYDAFDSTDTYLLFYHFFSPTLSSRFMLGTTGRVAAAVEDMRLRRRYYALLQQRMLCLLFEISFLL